MRVPSRAFRLVLVLAILVATPGCSSWRKGAGLPAEFIEQRKPRAVRVATVHGNQLILWSPVIEGDTLFGEPERGGARMAVPVDSVWLVESREGNTGGIIMVTVVGLLGLMLLVGSSLDLSM